MMNAVVSTIGLGKRQAANAAGTNAGDEIRARHSEELVIALSGPVGCGLSHVRDIIESELRELHYTIVRVKVSEQFSKLADQLGVEDPTSTSTGEFDRIWKNQDLGNELRKSLGDDLGAQIALHTIALDRLDKHPGVDVVDIRPGKVAYIVDQLKNPKEALLLRDVYGNLFYLVGVLSGYERRKQNLVANMNSAQAEQLIERDRAESGSGGQQLEKTLKLADFFVRNSHHNTQELSAPIKRFIRLIHGENGVSPTPHERGMYAAYGAALRSACLSRQVGAAIVDAKGTLVSTGCNDVPKAGGGLYEPGPGDHRCIFREGGVCYNDRHKDKLKDEITQILTKAGIDPFIALKASNEIRTGTRLKDLIEFSRAVHAEMDALIAAARNGGVGVQDALLFTTTYPCHNCARHIVAAGIRAVYFIEPYGKSLASELHYDAIDHDPEGEPERSQGGTAPRVAFLHFEGIAPIRFASLFYALDSRKGEDGRAIKVVASSASQKAPELLDNYRELEGRIAQRLERLTAGDLPREAG